MLRVRVRLRLRLRLRRRLRLWRRVRLRLRLRRPLQPHAASRSYRAAPPCPASRRGTPRVAGKIRRVAGGVHGVAAVPRQPARYTLVS